MQGDLNPSLGKACYFCHILATKANQQDLREVGKYILPLDERRFKVALQRSWIQVEGVENWGHFAIILTQ